MFKKKVSTVFIQMVEGKKVYQEEIKKSKVMDRIEEIFKTSNENYFDVKIIEGKKVVAVATKTGRNEYLYRGKTFGNLTVRF